MAVTMRQKPPRAILSKVRQLAQIARELSEGANFSITRLTTLKSWRENTRRAVRLRLGPGKLCSPVPPGAAQVDARRPGDLAYRSSPRLTPHSHMSAGVDDRQSPIWYGQRPQQLSSCPDGRRVCGTEPRGKCSSYDRRHAPPRRGLPAARDRPWWSCHLGVCLHSGYYPDTFQPRRPGAYTWGSGSCQGRSRLISPPLCAVPPPGSSPIAQLLLRKGASARRSPHSAARWSPRGSRCSPVVGSAPPRGSARRFLRKLVVALLVARAR